MKVLQWSMTIPKEKQKEFVKYFHKTMAPTFQRFGAKKHELYKVVDKEIIGRQTIEENRFIERVFFDDDFHIPNYFSKVKKDSEALKISKSYEKTFKAKNIELRILTNCG
jgi:hypothetical protein